MGEERECYFWGSPGRTGSFVGKQARVHCSRLGRDLSLSFFSGGLLWHQKLTVFRSCPVGLGSEVGDGEALPSLRCERTDSLTLVFGKEGLQMPSKTSLLFSQTQTMGRSCVVRPAEPKVQVYMVRDTGSHRQGPQRSAGEEKGEGIGVSETSLPECVNIQYQIKFK